MVGRAFASGYGVVVLPHTKCIRFVPISSTNVTNATKVTKLFIEINLKYTFAIFFFFYKKIKFSYIVSFTIRNLYERWWEKYTAVWVFIFSFTVYFTIFSFQNILDTFSSHSTDFTNQTKFLFLFSTGVRVYFWLVLFTKFTP